MSEPNDHAPTTAELEARVVAYVLGEGSADEHAEVERLLVERSELTELKQEIESVDRLLSESVAGEAALGDDDWRLSTERRAAVLEVLGDAPSPASLRLVSEDDDPRRISWRLALSQLTKVAAVLCLLVGAGYLALPKSLRPVVAAPVLGLEMHSHWATEEAMPASVQSLPSPYYLEDDVQYYARQEYGFSADGLNDSRGGVAKNLGPAEPALAELRQNLDSAGYGLAATGPGQVDASSPSIDFGGGDLRGGGRGVAGGGDGNGNGRALSASGAERRFRSSESDRLAGVPLVADLPATPMPAGPKSQPVPTEGLEGLGRRFAEIVETEAVPNRERLRESERSSELAAREELARRSSLSDPSQLSSSMIAGDLLGDTPANDKQPAAPSSTAKKTGLVDSRFDTPLDESILAFDGPVSSVLPPQRSKSEAAPILLKLADGLKASPQRGVISPWSGELAGGQAGQAEARSRVTSSIEPAPEPPLDGIAEATERAVWKSSTPMSESGLPNFFVEGSSNGAIDWLPQHNLDEVRDHDHDGVLYDLAGKQVLSRGDRVLADVSSNLDLPFRQGSFGVNEQSRRRPATGEVIGEKLAKDEAFSTFSLNVSDVSFQLAQAALAAGKYPDAKQVRVEEFVNGLDYQDPAPSCDEKIACRVEQAVHPFLQQRNVMRVSMRTAAAGRSSQTPLRLTLLLDNSGSMERSDRRQSVRQAFSTLAGQLGPEDQVTLIGFARQPRLLADKVGGADAALLVERAAEAPSEGGTNLEAALQLAHEKAREQHLPTAQNRVILLTDGAVNLGDADPNSLRERIAAMRSSGIAFDAAGICADGLNDEVLEALTRNGDGRYYLLDRPEQADARFTQQLAGALRPAAKNVKVQVEFNPDRVGRYKLLGFEKHRLNKEDFRNDSVDAAEMAAAEAGVALYQFEAKPDGEGDVGAVSVRFFDTDSGQMVENRWPIPYEPNAARLEQASPPLQLATAAGLLASKLKGDSLGSLVDLKTLSRLVDDLPAQFLSDGRVQQLRTMIQQTRQISGE